MSKEDLENEFQWFGKILKCDVPWKHHDPS